MVINFTDELIRRAIKDEKISTKLIKIFCLFNEDIHRWLLLNNDINLFSNIFSNYPDFLRKKIKQISMDNTIQDPKLFVQIYPDKKSLEDKLVEIKSSFSEIEVKKYECGNRLTVTYRGRTCEMINVDIVDDYIIERLKIVVENIDSDRTFMNLCLHLIGGVCNPNTELPITYLNGSGDNLIRQLSYLKSSERVICIIDSDQVEPNNYKEPSIPIKKNAIAELCNAKGFSLIILQKREVENYIPDIALVRGGHRSNHPYFSLEDHLKDYFDMKNGLTQKDLRFIFWSTPETPNVNVAATITNEKKTDVIIPGFGRKVWECFNYVDSHQELKTRDKLGELDKIVEKVLIYV